MGKSKTRSKAKASASSTSKHGGKQRSDKKRSRVEGLAEADTGEYGSASLGPDSSSATTERTQHRRHNATPPACHHSAEDMMAMQEEEKHLDRFLSFVPAHLYIPRTDAELDEMHVKTGIETRFWKVSGDAAIKKLLKETSKRGKRLRYERAPDAMTAQIARRAALAAEQSGKDGSGEAANAGSDSEKDDASSAAAAGGSADAARGTGVASADRTIDSLRERLQQRIQVLRKQRHADKVRTRSRSGRKQRQNGKTNKKVAAAESPATSDSKQQSATPFFPDVTELQFSSIDGLRSKDGAEIGAGRPGKRKNMRKLLAQAEKKQKRMQELRAAGNIAESSDAWDATMLRATGAKVLDDPKLLRKTMKRREVAKEKSRRKWREREKTLNDTKNASQDQREKNLQDRQERRQAKRAGKSLPPQRSAPRPGFEGRSPARIGGRDNGGAAPNK